MGISEHVQSFAGLPVREYDPEAGIGEPVAAAHRLSIDYDESDRGETLPNLLGRFLADPASRNVRVLVIGPWNGLYESEGSSAPIVAALAQAAGRLPALRAIFLGDITSEESEISWIQQSDVWPLLAAYPNLEELRVRGGGNLSFQHLWHERLRSLALESGGLPAPVVRAVAAAELPALGHLELWLGDSGYGGDATVADLAPILDGGRFPALKSLGLRNCEFADDLAVALAEAPVMRRLERLDLSLGTLGDRGALALVASGALAGLKSLDIHHHYVSEVILDGLKGTGVELDASDSAEPDEYNGESHRYVAVSE